MIINNLDQKDRNALVVEIEAKRQKLREKYRLALLNRDLDRAVHVQTQLLALNYVADDV